MIIVIDSSGNELVGAALEFGAGVQIRNRGNGVFRIGGLVAASAAPALTQFVTVTRDATRALTAERYSTIERVSKSIQIPHIFTVTNDLPPATAVSWRRVTKEVTLGAATVTRFYPATREVTEDVSLEATRENIAVTDEVTAKGVTRDVTREITDETTRQVTGIVTAATDEVTAKGVTRDVTREITDETTRQVTGIVTAATDAATVTKCLTREITAERTVTRLTGEGGGGASGCCADCYCWFGSELGNYTEACDAFGEAPGECPSTPGCSYNLTAFECDFPSAYGTGLTCTAHNPPFVQYDFIGEDSCL